MDLEVRNGTGGNDDEEYTNIYYINGDRRESAMYKTDEVTDMELKELFRNAAEAGPLDIVKLRKGDKLLNISTNLPENTPDAPYVLQIVGAHPASSRVTQAEVLWALERRVTALERQLREQQEALYASPSFALRELKRQVDSFKNKLEQNDQLNWLSFYKHLSEPIFADSCCKLQYRRMSDSMKRKVREKFLNICEVSVSSSVLEWLRSPSFDARQWEDEELLLLLQTMFIELDLPQKFNIPLPTLRNFLYEVYNNYNEVPFHNFRHCFCVAQMMYAIIWAANLPSRIGDLEVFILIVSCICHDLDHPGYNNIYQINARTELALRYNDISPLENHHCSVAFRILEAPECNILVSLDNATYRIVREEIIRCILATDMARHNEILGKFTDIIPEFDYSNKSHINSLSMILIKVADISNEARPMEVAEPWLDRLLQEFFKQSDMEKLEGLPVTPFMDRDKVTKPSSQVSFIGLVLIPLFEALGELLPELQSLIVQPVREALEYYRRLNEAAKDERHHRKSLADLGESTPLTTTPGGIGSSTVVKSTSSHSMRSKRSAGTIHSRSRSTDEDITENLTAEDAENLESSDPETATEVEVSEKALKFKISTEGSLVGPPSGRKSYPGSRKGSREKSSLDYHNHDLARAVREHERRRSKGENFGSDLNSPVSARSAEGTRILEELEKDDTVLSEKRLVEGNGNLVVETQQRNNLKRTGSLAENDQEVRSSRKEVQRESIGLRCCCDDKGGSNNHKSLFSRLRNFTDRLNISFDSKDSPSPKLTKHVTKTLNKSNSVSNASSPTTSSRHNNASLPVCKRCNLAKPAAREGKAIATVVELSSVDKRATTLPKVRKSADCKNKSWRTVFAKEKSSSTSLETLPGAMSEASLTEHRRNFSNPEGKSQSLKEVEQKNLDIEFGEINVPAGKQKQPEIVVETQHVSREDVQEDVGKIEIRRSSASMEDISKMTKQTESVMLGSLEPKKAEERPHAGSLDSMLCKDSTKSRKKPLFSSPATSKKSSPGLLSRFKSGMSVDSTRSNSNSDSLHDQNSQSPSGWISSLTASFRPKRQVLEAQAPPSSHPPRSPSREEIK
ncbi:cAMP-specific 3',5'-cyclic phosphodiesterase 4D [Colletes gigas]|uniref:cAMP-specific 3',5'-cyclic phosphodiesterase 4D n=1 Tax=Colletes gigas TaxID=935657 RepID=UPI001C9A6DA9|nr:cAMP-specific 3',5'-cyclic phosphodiesterase 4D [Colletes gigas]XP_043249701.1 cAMP-specific 3',5'-cyclic phosphodiesterase 4D [Colletes gigas]XP_043249702.1 cAMP-specific 3',5'-cyclic phosphodiesterase 4D [Colletes gigas]XP_043249703.1 cAMP-specific 3',5'-cyclic phosphodiesterase 4D [Colletes gigas]